MPEVYRSNASTGEVYETKSYSTPQEKADLLRLGWWETPRWKTDPRPLGPSQDNPFERTTAPTPPWPRVVHGQKLTTKSVPAQADLDSALASGWTLAPQGETWIKGESSWTVYTQAERDVMQAENVETRKAQKAGALPDDPALFWRLAKNATTPDDTPDAGGDPAPVKRGPGRPRSVN